MLNELFSLFKKSFGLSSTKPRYTSLQCEFFLEYNLRQFLTYFFELETKNLHIDCLPTEKVKFENKYGWDVFIDNCEYYYCSCEHNEECFCEEYKLFRKKHNIYGHEENLKIGILFCKTIEVLDKDFNNLLRNIKKQIQKTNRDLIKHNHKIRNELKRMYRDGGFETLNDYIRRVDNTIITPGYALILRKFKGDAILKFKLLEECKQARIKLIFWNDIFDDLQNTEYVSTGNC